jgi:hypothetical protein
MTSVYVLSRGSYSDYCIEGIFSTERKAIEFAEQVLSIDEKQYKIEVFELDKLSEVVSKGLKPYLVYMEKDGTVLEISQTSESNEDYGFAVGNKLYCIVFARDKDHAVKLTNERRSQLIFEGKWK